MTIKQLNYIPFGSQYYRAPTPSQTDWLRDLTQFKQQGFNTIKVWAQWRWNHPAPDVFDFSDLQELLDLSADLGIKAVINLILDSAPAWLFKHHPDCVMVTADGRKLTPVTTGYRQSGGVPGHCFHHPQAGEESVKFVEETGRQFAGHPALAFWDLWNEPELTVGLLREPRISDLVCYCDHSRLAFVMWLQHRYGCIDTLNQAWARRYQDWDELELPAQPHTYRDFIDWRMFFVDTMRDELIRRKNAIRRFDNDHPVMCHTVPPPIFPVVSCASDDWLFAESGDLHGNSIGSDPFAADLVRSASSGKPVINAEIHALGGSTFNRPQPIGEAEMKRHILIPLAHGIKGFLFWQYRPERLGAESPAWGLTKPDGSESPWLGPVSRIARAVLAEEKFFLNAQPAAPRVAILADPENQVFCWAGTLRGDLYAKSLDGAYRALYRAGYAIGFVHPSDFPKEAHRHYACIYLPIPYWISSGAAGELCDYVESGGHLISEIWPAAYDSRSNLHSTTTPGMGLDRLFGAVEHLSWPQPSTFSAYAMWKAAGYEEGGLQLVMAESIGGLPQGDKVPVQLAVSQYNTSANILARLPDGAPAIVENEFGEGVGILTGALLGFSSAHPDGKHASALISGLVERCIGKPEVNVIGPGRADVLTSGPRRFVVVSNDLEEPAIIRAQLPGGIRGLLGNEPPPTRENEWLSFQLPGRAVEGYWLD